MPTRHGIGMDIVGEIARRGGAAKTMELLAAGATAGRIRWALASGQILRARKAWYVLPGTPADLIAAVRVGGRATCVTALRRNGVWVTRAPVSTHVAVHRAACQLRSARRHDRRQTVLRDAVVHWTDTAKPRDVDFRLAEPVVVALRDAAGCLSHDDFYASAESARRLRLVSAAEWRWLLSAVPVRERRVLADAGPLSASGLESLFSRRMRRLGLPIRQQVQIGPDRVDILIGERLVVELDGAAFHDRGSDYRRDARVSIAGFRTLRFDYGQVVDEWSSVESAVVAAIARGDHIR